MNEEELRNLKELYKNPEEFNYLVLVRLAEISETLRNIEILLQKEEPVKEQREGIL